MPDYDPNVQIEATMDTASVKVLLSILHRREIADVLPDLAVNASAVW